ncbi:hypothetical protein BU26DRAFT_306033 [Trematosphaeria pertusa]|uniref:Uncharacterized protein n=1 Tax=Trematosphaeria pertusa TaxID=390896 RepID=A0A6A6IEG6_9PLEO|nr:uncharacterized protein BU26DRAFT_306033 [Trematosphaeria pertusa]KAF2248801.1 hypothetical protein BU26DRAFT_306033 [Trematosphaeria pertusa]
MPWLLVLCIAPKTSTLRFDKDAPFTPISRSVPRFFHCGNRAANQYRALGSGNMGHHNPHKTIATPSLTKLSTTPPKPASDAAIVSADMQIKPTGLPRPSGRHGRQTSNGDRRLLSASIHSALFSSN